MPECIHGLEFAMCDICNPPKRVEPVATPRRAPAVRTTRPAPVKNRSEQRLHVVVSLDDFGDLLADGELVDPIYFHGPEELAWSERRRAADSSRNVVLVTSQGAITGLDVLPLAAVQLVAVANTNAQERVRDLLALTDFTPRVSVFPPWFVATD
jgi:hypothetical protein